MYINRNIHTNTNCKCFHAFTTSQELLLLQAVHILLFSCINKKSPSSHGLHVEVYKSNQSLTAELSYKE